MNYLITGLGLSLLAFLFLGAIGKFDKTDYLNVKTLSFGILLVVTGIM